MSARAWFGATLVLIGLMWALVERRYREPPPRDEQTPAAEFSAARAMHELRSLLDEGAPHPLGSDAQVKVRARLMARLAELGFAPEEQPAFACALGFACGFVHNVIARRQGVRPEAGAVLLIAHYDSMPSGPGASDDGSGVAVLLETARALTASPASARAVIFLFSDGEERGLLGARAFADEHPWATQVSAVINLDARGASGPSLLFETVGASGPLVAAFAEGSRRPVSNSLFTAIYEAMPNDTDLSVFRSRGVSGANFGLVRDVARYHTPLDTLEGLNAGSVQQQGDNALGLTRVLSRESRMQGIGDVVWFDVFAAFIVRLPRVTMLPLAIAAMLAIAFGVERARNMRRVLWCIAAIVGSIGGAVAAATVLGWGLGRAGAIPAPFIARPGALELAIAWFAFVAAALASRWVKGMREVAFVVWCAWALAGIVSAIVLPGASYLFVIPALVAGAAGTIERALRAPASAAPSALGAIAAACLWLPTIAFVGDVLGVAMPFVLAAPIAWLVTSLLPLLSALDVRARLAVAGGFAAFAFSSTALALVSPPFTADFPQPVNVAFVQDDARGQTRTLLDTMWEGTSFGAPPKALRAALGPAATRGAALPWVPGDTVVAPSPSLHLSPPVLDVVANEAGDGGRRHVRAVLRSNRGARTLRLRVDEGASALRMRIEGKLWPAREPVDSSSPFRLWTVYGVPDVGVAVELDAPAALGEIDLIDETYDLPIAAAAVARARPGDAEPFQDGDETVVIGHAVF